MSSPSQNTTTSPNTFDEIQLEILDIIASKKKEQKKSTSWFGRAISTCVKYSIPGTVLHLIDGALTTADVARYKDNWCKEATKVIVGLRFGAAGLGIIAGVVAGVYVYRIIEGKEKEIKDLEYKLSMQFIAKKMKRLSDQIDAIDNKIDDSFDAREKMKKLIKACNKELQDLKNNNEVSKDTKFSEDEWLSFLIHLVKKSNTTFKKAMDKTIASAKKGQTSLTVENAASPTNANHRLSKNMSPDDMSSIYPNQEGAKEKAIRLFNALEEELGIGPNDNPLTKILLEDGTWLAKDGKLYPTSEDADKGTNSFSATNDVVIDMKDSQKTIIKVRTPSTSSEPTTDELGIDLSQKKPTKKVIRESSSYDEAELEKIYVEDDVV